MSSFLNTPTLSYPTRNNLPNNKHIINFREFISSKNLRNFILQDTLLDWLEKYQGTHKFLKDNEKDDFKTYLSEQTIKFKELLFKEFNKTGLKHVFHDKLESSSNYKITLEHMKEGVPILYNHLICDLENKLYSFPTIMIRSDYLKTFFPDSKYHKYQKSSYFNLEWHYVIVEIVYSKIKVNLSGNVSNTHQNIKLIKSKMALSQDILNKIQGTNNHIVYLMGRKLQIGDYIFKNCMESYYPIDLSDDSKWIKINKDAIKWCQNLKEGSDWKLSPPSRRELYPNMKNIYDSPWHKAKKTIAHKINEITLFWNCGIKFRNKAHQEGIYDWKNINNSSFLDTDKYTHDMIQQIIQKHQDSTVFKMKDNQYSQFITETDNTIEIYLDLETINDLFDSFENFPYTSGNELIFMIGNVVLFKKGETQRVFYKSFTSKDLKLESELEILTLWLDYIQELKELFQTDRVKLYHWGHIEKTALEKSFFKHYIQNPELEFVDLNFYFKKIPVLINSISGFGLKNVASYFYQKNLIYTNWEEEVFDGKTAMIKTWNCYKNKTIPVTRQMDMQYIQKYNFIDCMVLYEILDVIRKNMI